MLSPNSPPLVLASTDFASASACASPNAAVVTSVSRAHHSSHSGIAARPAAAVTGMPNHSSPSSTSSDHHQKRVNLNFSRRISCSAQYSAIFVLLTSLRRSTKLTLSECPQLESAPRVLPLLLLRHTVKDRLHRPRRWCVHVCEVYLAPAHGHTGSRSCCCAAERVSLPRLGACGSCQPPNTWHGIRAGSPLHRCASYGIAAASSRRCHSRASCALCRLSHGLQHRCTAACRSTWP